MWHIVADMRSLKFLALTHWSQDSWKDKRCGRCTTRSSQAMTLWNKQQLLKSQVRLDCKTLGRCWNGSNQRTAALAQSALFRQSSYICIFSCYTLHNHGAGWDVWYHSEVNYFVKTLCSIPLASAITWWGWGQWQQSHVHNDHEGNAITSDNKTYLTWSKRSPWSKREMFSGPCLQAHGQPSQPLWSTLAKYQETSQIRLDRSKDMKRLHNIVDKVASEWRNYEQWMLCKMALTLTVEYRCVCLPMTLASGLSKKLLHY